MAKKDLTKGLLITFEGPEGSGKSTHLRLLCSYLRRRRFQVLQLREPGGTGIGEKIRCILLDPKNNNMDAVSEMLLYSASRAQLVREKILPALKAKKIVIVDRFLDATICYQGFGARLDINIIRRIARLVTGGIQPDLTVLLDIDAREGLRRAKRCDRIEKKSLHFHRRVRQGYLTLANRCPRRIKVLPVAYNIAKTQDQIRMIIDCKVKKFTR